MKKLLLIGVLVLSSLSFGASCSTNPMDHVNEITIRNKDEVRIITIASANEDVAAIKRVLPALKATKAKILHIINNHDLNEEQLSSCYNLLSSYNKLIEMGEVVASY
ncbi:MAG: hypothetical protein ACRCZ2_06920 [Fusobacteriaceae bacterium]